LHYIVGLDYTLAYIIAVWASWSLNLALAELVLRRRPARTFELPAEEAALP
jgi:hypothetical protein